MHKVMYQPAKPVSVVIIDDNLFSAEFVSTALAREGVQIYSAADPREGLALVYRHHPNVVVTDLVLPGMSGLEVLDRVVKFDPKVAVVLMTAYYSRRSAEEAKKRHAVDYLQKPIPLALLRERVGKLIDQALKGISIGDDPADSAGNANSN